MKKAIYILCICVLLITTLCACEQIAKHGNEIISGVWNREKQDEQPDSSEEALVEITLGGQTFMSDMTELSISDCRDISPLFHFLNLGI